MDATEYFKKQIETRQSKVYHYILTQNNLPVIKSFRGVLSAFPDLTYLGHYTDTIPMFKEMK